VNTEAIDQDQTQEDILRHIISRSTAELNKLQSQNALETRDQLRKQRLAGLAKSVAEHIEQVARFDSLIASAYEDLRVAVEERHRDFRSRFHLAESKVGVERCTNALLLMMNGKLEQELGLRNVRERYEDALRLEETLTKK
jgi:ATP-dependent protease HslVU (ClpYQ) peptidase subunit